MCIHIQNDRDKIAFLEAKTTEFFIVVHSRKYSTVSHENICTVRRKVVIPEYLLFVPHFSAPSVIAKQAALQYASPDPEVYGSVVKGKGVSRS